MANIPTNVPAPASNPETLKYWEEAGQNRLLFKRCRACGEPHFYPRAHCPFCLSADTEWIEASGRGTIESYSVMERAAPPYIICYVKLMEGPIMMSGLIGDVANGVRIGDAVEVCFVQTSQGAKVPFFKKPQAE